MTEKDRENLCSRCGLLRDNAERGEAVRRLGHRYTGRTEAGYYYSTNEEHFEGEGESSHEGALAEARECDPEADTVWTGLGIEQTLASYADGKGADSKIVDMILESAREQAYDEAGDYADYGGRFLAFDTQSKKDTTQLDELRDTLMRAIDEWATRYERQPTFFSIEDTKEHG
jgi:hypothetical protein